MGGGLVVAAALVAAMLLPAKAAAPPAADIIRESCRATQYPSVCMRSLSSDRHSTPPRNPQEVALAALTLSADRARAASALVVRVAKEHGGGPVRDCMENMADSVEWLREAAREMGSAGSSPGGEFRWHLSNAQTWCSAALTDENTCLDGLGQSPAAATRDAVRNKVVEVAQVTSNALALVNRISTAGH